MTSSDILIKNQPILSKIFNKIRNTENNVQAYILYGESKEMLEKYATLFSKILICPHKYEENCDKCNICMRIDNNSYGELKIINPVNKMIKKEAIIELRDYFQTESIEGRNQVYIINDIETLNVAAANSILKFLEEPDSNSVAIFTTTNLDAVISTIASRCQIIKINNVRTKFGIEFVQEISGLDEENIYNITDFVKKIEKNPVMAFANLKTDFMKSFDNKDTLTNALQVMMLYYKDMLNYKIKNKCLYFEVNDLKSIAEAQTTDVITRKISFILENIPKIEYNVNILLFMHNLLIGIGEIANDKGNRN